nr:hypothetical protein [Caldilineaceae bacterium]
QQVQVEPTGLWLQVEGGVGAHGGVYALYRFADQGLKREVLASSARPPAGQLDDLNGDGVPEVVLDVSDSYVFCYACGGRYAQYNILRWDGARMATVTLTPLADSAPPLLQEANQAAMTLAAAGLWKDAEEAVDKGAALNVEDPLFEWNAVYIQYNAEAKAEAARSGNASVYPILDNLFYGDYSAAVETMRAYAPDEIFALRTPLIDGTPAEGATQQLANRILSSVEPVLKVRPNLAAAYYLRGWATFLKNGFADENVLADVERAAQLAANDRLFADTVAYFGGDPSALSVAAPQANTTTLTLTPPLSGTIAGSDTITASAVTTAAASTPPLASVTGTGRLYFSGPDVDGHNAIFVVAPTAGAEATRVVADAVQPALQPGGARLAFHTTRDDMLGLGGFDLTTGERVRFTFNVEDTSPTWNPAGDQLFFASTRYGDGRWRLYQVWADGNANATDMRYGQDPAWHPREDLIVYKGCDDAGGHCGLWLTHSDGSARQPLTDNPGDARPRWSPDGETVVFMSDQRDGNWELYSVAVASGAVTRLTENAANDGLPVVSPDGTTVAFVSDRAGSWAIWTAPFGGGVAEELLPLGELPNWLEQGLDWVE